MADTWDVEEDSGLPEEGQAKLEQTNTVRTNERAPWKVPGEEKSIFQNYDDLVEFGKDVYMAKSAKWVITVVIDNNDPPHTAHYPNNKQFFVGEINLDTGDVDWLAYTEFFIKLLDEEVPINESAYNKFKINSVQVGTYRGIPIYVPDPDFNHNRPATQEGSTTSTTTGTTVVTTTTSNPAAAGTVTTTQVIPANVPAPTYDDAILRQARNATGPCLPATPPVTTAGGSGAVPTPAPTYDDAILRQARAQASTTSTTSSTMTYDDAILRQARAASAAPAVTYDDAILRQARTRSSSGTSTAPAQAAAAAAATTAPTTVTTPPSTPTPRSTPTPASTANVYIYEPLSPGFDRYDFNSGKKVFTPDTGPSRNSSNVPVTPTSAPRVSAPPPQTAASITSRLSDVDQAGRIRGGL